MRTTNKYLAKLERIVAIASLIAASLGLIEKGVHYAGILKRTYRKRRKPNYFGFQPYPEVRKHVSRSK